MQTGDLFIFIVFGGGILTGILYVISDAWKKTRIAEQNAVLKKEMIERGFRPDDIIRVLEAGMPIDDGQSKDVATSLVDHGYSSDDITAITTAYDRCSPNLKGSLRSSVVKMIHNGYKGRKIVAYIDSRVAASGERREQPAAI
jgi:hypothetical protein